MKKVMFAAMAALAITSCSQNEEMDAPGKNDEIRFGTIVKTSTKATPVTTDNIQQFTVSGFKTADDMAGDTQLATGFMDDVLVKKSGNVWTSGTFYWPISGKVQFFGTEPAQTLNLEAAGYPKFDYVVGAIADQKDLIAAYAANKSKSSGQVQLAFQHLLTQVNFSIKGDTEDFTYTVTKLEIVDAKDKGTFTFSEGPTVVGAWSAVAVSGTPAGYVYAGSATVAPTTASPDEVTSLEAQGNALFMLMPQDVSTVKVKITYTAAPTAKPSEYTFDGDKEITLKGTWEMGKNIRYTLTLSSDASPVEFGNPSVGDWGTEAPGQVE